MKKIMRLMSIVASSFALGSCAASSMVQGEANVTVVGANYTNDYIDFALMSASGNNLGIGESAKPFSMGGSGGWSCCAVVPGVGQPLRVKSKVGAFNDAADQFKTYEQQVVVAGSMPSPKEKLQSYLSVRFIPNHEVEAELFASDDSGPENPRVDRLFSVGPRVIRHKGE